MDGAQMIAAERRRQIEVRGYSAEHDDEHGQDELALAAVCYALPQDVRYLGAMGMTLQSWLWPGSPRNVRGNLMERWDFNEGDRIRELVKAGALIAAEIDRLAGTTPDAPQEAE